jgi:ketosteroid isomerase-like protein
MRFIAFIAALAATCALGGCISISATETAASAERACAVATTGADVDAVRRLEARGAAVNVEGWDIEEARGFFAPEWASVQPDGSVLRLDSVFAGFQDGRSRPWAQSFTHTELDVRVACDSAVVIGLAEVRPRGAPEGVVVRTRFLNVWRKQDGRWLYAANQYVRL